MPPGPSSSSSIAVSRSIRVRPPTKTCRSAGRCTAIERRRSTFCGATAATFLGDVDRVRALLGEDPALARAAKHNGVTPLWWLPDDEDKALALVELLIAAGADPAARNLSGRTAADWARRRGMLAIAQRLESGR